MNKRQMDGQQAQARVEAGLNDFLMMLLKAVVLKQSRVTGQPFVGLTKGDIMRAEECDLNFQKDRDGDVRLAAVPGQDPQQTKIIVPNGSESPIQVYQSIKDGKSGG